jgi:hypothetical protein
MAFSHLSLKLQEKIIINNVVLNILLNNFIYYSNALHKVVMEIYKEHTWNPWEFHALPHKFWHQKENQKKFMDWISIQRGNSCMDDWYTITSSEFIKYVPSNLFNVMFTLY